MQDKDISVLWHRLKEGDQQAREELIFHYIPLVQQVVNRFLPFLPKNIESQDLISYGIIGLISALERFDPEKDVKFETFAYWRVRGEILDFLRRQDIIPKQQRIKIKQIRDKYLELGVNPESQEGEEAVAKDLGLDIEEVREAIRVDHLAKLVSLSEVIGEEIALEDVIPSPEDPYEYVNRDFLKEQLVEIISKLDKRSQNVLELYFNEGLTLKEIGQVLDLSEGRVSQLLSSILFFLRVNLEREGAL